jgi:hypothetical protein
VVAAVVGVVVDCDVDDDDDDDDDAADDGGDDDYDDDDDDDDDDADDADDADSDDAYVMPFSRTAYFVSGLQILIPLGAIPTPLLSMTFIFASRSHRNTIYRIAHSPSLESGVSKPGRACKL